MKKVLSLVLSLVMLLASTAGIGFTALADDANSGKCGDNVFYTFDAATGTVTITGTGDMMAMVQQKYLCLHILKLNMLLRAR